MGPYKMKNTMLNFRNAQKIIFYNFAVYFFSILMGK